MVSLDGLVGGSGFGLQLIGSLREAYRRLPNLLYRRFPNRQAVQGSNAVACGAAGRFVPQSGDALRVLIEEETFL